MDTPKLETIARNRVVVFASVAVTTRRLREAMAELEEAAIRAAITQIEEDEYCDPIAKLLEAMEEVREQVLLEELAIDPADIEMPRKMPRPPKKLGPINKENYTARRPPRQARSSCYRCRH